MIVSVIVVTIIALGTLAFGAVYPWGYLPLFSAAALIGIAGLVRGGLRRDLRPLAGAIVLLCAAGLVQLLPVLRATLDVLSPHASAVLSRYSLTFGASTGHPLSINPAATRIAVFAVIALGLYLLGLPALLGGRGARMVPGHLAILAMPLALYGIYTREHHSHLIYGFWKTLEGGGTDQFGPFVNRNHFGGWILMVVCLLIGRLFGQVERALPQKDMTTSRRLEWLSSAEANGILVSGAVVLVAVTSLVWTMSRSAMVGFGISAAVFVGLLLRRRRLSGMRRGVVLAALGVILLVGVARRGPLRLVEWFQDDRSLLGRLDAWRDGWSVVRDFPVFGTGLNTYPTAMLFYQTPKGTEFVAQAHNDYLQLLAEGGLLVAIPAAIVIFLLARAIYRNMRAARGEARGYWIRAGAAIGLLAVGVQEVFEFSLQIPANALLFCTLAAIALTPVSAHSSRQ